MGIVKSQLLREFGNNFPNFHKKDLNKIFSILIEEIKQSLKNNESVEIRSFGRFSVRNNKKKIARNPKHNQNNTPKNLIILFSFLITMKL